jgi:hypothetical protein
VVHVAPPGDEWLQRVTPWNFQYLSQ